MGLHSKLYAQSVGKSDLISPDGIIEEEQTQAAKHNDDAARQSLIHSWRAATITQEMFAELKKEENTLLEEAINWANASPVEHQHKIVNNLVKVHQLRKLNKQYASH